MLYRLSWAVAEDTHFEYFEFARVWTALTGGPSSSDHRSLRRVTLEVRRRRRRLQA
jgi:hypothetical protein